MAVKRTTIRRNQIPFVEFFSEKEVGGSNRFTKFIIPRDTQIGLHECDSTLTVLGPIISKCSNATSVISGNLTVLGTVNFGTSSGVTDGTNIGGGPGEVFSSKNGQILEFRTISGSGGIDVTTAGDLVIISGSGGGGAGTITSGTNVGNGEGKVFKDILGNALRFRSIRAGHGVDIENGTNEVVITVSSSQELTYYHGYSTGSFIWDSTSWENAINVIPDSTITDVNEVGITRTNLSWTFVSSGIYFADIAVNAQMANRHFALRLSGTNGIRLEQVGSVGASSDMNRGKISGLVPVDAGEVLTLQYALDAANPLTWSNAAIDGSFSRSANFTFFNFIAASGSIFQPVGSSTDLDAAYDNGRTITVDNGAVQMQGSLGINTLEVTGAVDIDGGLSATSKSFFITHPDPNKKGFLRHGSLEGPEHGVYVRGESKVLAIQLPDYWKYLIDYKSITVDLTPIGFHQPIYLKEIDKQANRIVVGCEGLISHHFYYRVNAERKDIRKIKVEEIDD